MNDELEETLKERGARYGDYQTHAAISQSLQNICRVHDDNYSPTPKYTPQQRETLTMICHKLARIVNGDPNYDDTWKDIAGYAMLQAKICKEGSKQCAKKDVEDYFEDLHKAVELKTCTLDADRYADQYIRRWMRNEG